MNDDLSRSPGAEPESASEATLRDFVIPGVWIGYALALAGVVIGVVMAFQRDEVGCDKAVQCYKHQQALEGSVVAIVAALLGILIGIAGAIARKVLADPPSTTA